MRITFYCIHLIIAINIFAQTDKPIYNIKPDERYKTDILLIVAHPDDETAIGSYLAKAIYDDNKQVSIVYTNRGQGGGNSYGVEQASSMGLIREIEARKAALKFGITNVWFLNGYDSPGQDVFRSLGTVSHGETLEKIIRIIRLTRPEVIFTWLPDFVSGENHGDHQASGVIATEAFDMAGDPTVFPQQVAFPRERTDISNFNEGVNPWQAKKIYYFSDREEPIDGPGPKFNISDVSKSKKIPYYQLAAELSTPHLTQADVSESAIKALKTKDYSEFEKYMSRFHLLFGKSLVKCNPRGDVFEGIRSESLGYIAPQGYKEETGKEVNIELGGAFAFYRKFWKVHSIENLASLVQPEITVAVNSYLNFPIVLSNYTNDSVNVELKPLLPEGWKVSSGIATYHLAPNEVFPVQTFIIAASEKTTQPIDISWEALVGGNVIGRVTIRVGLSEWTLPQ